MTKADLSKYTKKELACLPSCYDIKTNTCDGSCQGCSGCPRVEGGMSRVTRRQMVESYVEVDKTRKEMDKIMNTPKMKKWVKDFRRKYPKGIVGKEDEDPSLPPEHVEEEVFVLMAKEQLPDFIVVNGIVYRMHSNKLAGGGYRTTYGEWDIREGVYIWDHVYSKIIDKITPEIGTAIVVSLTECQGPHQHLEHVRHEVQKIPNCRYPKIEETRDIDNILS